MNNAYFRKILLIYVLILLFVLITFSFTYINAETVKFCNTSLQIVTNQDKDDQVLVTNIVPLTEEEMKQVYGSGGLCYCFPTQCKILLSGCNCQTKPTNICPCGSSCLCRIKTCEELNWVCGNLPTTPCPCGGGSSCQCSICSQNQNPTPLPCGGTHTHFCQCLYGTVNQWLCKCLTEYCTARDDCGGSYNSGLCASCDFPLAGFNCWVEADDSNPGEFDCYDSGDHPRCNNGSCHKHCNSENANSCSQLGGLRSLCGGEGCESCSDGPCNCPS